MSLVTRPAPDFTKPAILPNGSFEDNYNLHSHIRDKYAVLFFYPLDFTFVCPSEIIAHSQASDNS
jgi:peroxiredoxin (alkyl hydroperoxide reductase subunit C)